MWVGYLDIEGIPSLTGTEVGTLHGILNTRAVNAAVSPYFYLSGAIPDRYNITIEIE